MLGPRLTFSPPASHPSLPFLTSPPLSPSPPLFRFPLELGHLNAARGFGEHCKLPQWGLGRSPSRQTIWFIFESKSAALVAAIFCGVFRRNICNFHYFLHKNNYKLQRKSIMQKYGTPHVEINLQDLQVCKLCKLQIQVIEGVTASQRELTAVIALLSADVVDCNTKFSPVKYATHSM